jgi:aldose 1-epimerase
MLHKLNTGSEAKTTEVFGHYEGQQIDAVTISNKAGVKAKLITFGARLCEFHTPDRDGKFEDIVLGFDSIEEYAATDTYFGATCGRYGNRIRDGRFSIDGEEYQLNVNEGRNHLHGGQQGFDRKVWTIDSLTENSVTFTSISEDGEMGFPGRSNLRSTYTITDDNELTILMEADTTKPTLMNMVHHSYFNLAGQGSGSVLGHRVKMASHFYTPVDEHLLATGEILSVTGTPFDFSEFKAIGTDIEELSAVGGEIFESGGGYDHNWCLDAGPALHKCIAVLEPKSGRKMTMLTSEPGLQFYTAGYLSDAVMGKKGRRLCKYGGFTLETQKFPDTPNFGHFPGCELRPGEQYRQEMVFRFSTEDAR